MKTSSKPRGEKLIERREMVGKLTISIRKINRHLIRVPDDKATTDRVKTILSSSQSQLCRKASPTCNKTLALIQTSTLRRSLHSLHLQERLSRQLARCSLHTQISLVPLAKASSSISIIKRPQTDSRQASLFLPKLSTLDQKVEEAAIKLLWKLKIRQASFACSAIVKYRIKS